MTKLEKMTAREFLRLPKKEQKRINNLNRIPVPKPGYMFEGKKDKPRIKRWDVEMW